MSDGGRLDHEELDRAAWHAVRGGAVGAVKWGIGAALLGGAAYVYSPIYRGLTIQFKVFIQMSAMTLGGFIDGDRYMRLHESRMRFARHKQIEDRKQREREAEFQYEVGQEAGGDRVTASSTK